jgi:putative tricarboxylic transport membrane protein
MVRGDKISGIFWLFFSLMVAVESYRLGVGNLHSPQAGFLPFVASAILAILSFILLLSTKAKKMPTGTGREVEDISFNWNLIPKVLYVAISLFLYAIFLNALGFILVSVILMAFMLRAIEPQKWYVVTLGAFLIPVTAYLLFDVFLKVQLPKGFLGI